MVLIGTTLVSLPASLVTGDGKVERDGGEAEDSEFEIVSLADSLWTEDCGSELLAAEDDPIVADGVLTVAEMLLLFEDGIIESWVVDEDSGVSQKVVELFSSLVGAEVGTTIDISEVNDEDLVALGGSDELRTVEDSAEDDSLDERSGTLDSMFEEGDGDASELSVEMIGTKVVGSSDEIDEDNLLNELLDALDLMLDEGVGGASELSVEMIGAEVVGFFDETDEDGTIDDVSDSLRGALREGAFDDGPSEEDTFEAGALEDRVVEGGIFEDAACEVGSTEDAAFEDDTTEETAELAVGPTDEVDETTGIAGGSSLSVLQLS